MTSFTVTWSKTYYMTGEFNVEADDMFGAEVLAHCLIDDQEGSLDYNPCEDNIEVQLNDT